LYYETSIVCLLLARAGSRGQSHREVALIVSGEAIGEPSIVPVLTRRDGEGMP
jgi:hypothetical protein